MGTRNCLVTHIIKKYLLLGSAEKRNSYQSGTTEGGINEALLEDKNEQKSYDVPEVNIGGFCSSNPVSYISGICKCLLSSLEWQSFRHHNLYFLAPFFILYYLHSAETLTLLQWSPNLARGIHFPAEFSSNPDQTRLPVIFIFRMVKDQQSPSKSDRANQTVSHGDWISIIIKKKFNFWLTVAKERQHFQKGQGHF